MSVTAETVRQLRERTGAGMMECKKALVETGGDLDAAAELMRKQGLAKADKKASRVAAEGVIAMAVAADGKSAVLVEVNSETDFVARGDDFTAFAAEVAQLALATAHKHGKDGTGPSVEAIKEGDKVVRIVVTCSCGERIEIDCLYPAGG